MREQLRQAFDDLASSAPGSTASSPDHLWLQGRRRQRRRQGLTALVMVLVVGLGGLIVGETSLRPRDAAVAVTPGTVLSVPLSLWPAPGTLPGSDEVGPPGRIAALWRDDRVGLLGARQAWVGVSAVDGSYRFLDGIPEEAHQITLSPDGRFVAWGFTDDVEGRPEPVTVGWAVYDAQTGRVLRRDLRDEAPYGVDLGLGAEPPVWTADSRSLTYRPCIYRRYDAEVGSSCRVATHVWQVLTGEVTRLELEPDEQIVGREGDRMLVATSAYDDEPAELRMRILDPSTGDLEASTQLDEIPLFVRAMVSLPDAARYLLVGQTAVPEGNGDTGYRFGFIEAGGTDPNSAPFLLPPTEQVVQTVGAIPVPGGTGVAVVTALWREADSGTTYRLRSWDADGGIADQVQTRNGFTGRDLLIAADPVAAGAFVDANLAPSGGTDPRVLAAVFFGVVLAAAALWWRRRGAV